MIAAEIKKDKRILEKQEKINNKLTSELKKELVQRIKNRLEIVGKELFTLEKKKKEKNKTKIEKDKRQQELDEILESIKEKREENKRKIELKEIERIKKYKNIIKQQWLEEQTKIKKSEEQKKLEEKRLEELKKQEIQPKKEKLLIKIENLKERMNEYKKAITYFETMNNTKKVKEFTEKANKIEEIIIKIEKNEEYDESIIPPVITPEFIFGDNKEEKMKQYDKIICYFVNRQKEIEDDLNSNKKYDISKLIPEIKKRIEDTNKKFKDLLKKEIQRIIEVVQTIKKLKENPWIPLPLFEKIQGQELVKVINEEVKENTIDFQIVKIEKDGQTFGDFCVLLLPQGSVELISINNDNFNGGKCIYEQIIQLKPEKMNKIYEQNIELVIYKNNNFKNIKIGKATINLDFTEHCTINKNYPIFLLNNEVKDSLPQVRIKAKIRESLYALEYEVIQKEIMEITKIYPPFINENNKSQNKEDFKEINLSPPIQYSDINLNNYEESNNENIIDENEFTQNEINDPQHIKCLHLDKLSNDLETFMNGTNPKELIKDYKKTQSQIKQMINKIEDIESLIDQYLSIITDTLHHEKKLLTFFIKKNENDKIEIMKNKINYLNEQLQKILLLKNDLKI